MRRTFIFCTIFIFVFSLAKSQKNFWNSKDAYLGQTRPENIPLVFAKGVLADTGIVFCRIAFSNNGKEIYYTFAKDWNDYTGSGTSSMFFDGKKWVKSKTLFPELAEPTFSIDEQSLYLRGKGSIIWKADRINNGWSKPHKYLDMPYGLYNLMPTLSGNFYVGSNGNVSDKNDYSSYKFSLFTISQKDTVVKSLGSPLNQPGFNGDLFIAPDESYIIISTNETPDYESELYISFRKKDKTWTQPVSLGAEINTGKAHRFGQYVTPDGKYLFYTWGTSSKDCATYWVRFDTLLKKLKPAEL